MSPGDEENKFQKAIAAWRNIDLTTLVPTLDTAAYDLNANQRDTLTQRKDLAQKTKEFRKLDDAGKLAEIKGLLKSYQTFIDLISNQSKSISTAFFQVYTPLSEAPDPYPLLEASVESLVTSIDTVPRLEKENQELHKNVKALSTQLEETEVKLQEERTTRQALEETRDSEVKEIESTWSAVLGEKQDNCDAKVKSLEDKLESQDRLLKEIKASYEVSQRLDRGEEAENEGARSSATAAELEVVSSELERTNLRLADVEARNEQLRLELAQSASQSHRTRPEAVEDDPVYQRLQSENQILLRKLGTTRLEKESENRRIEGEIRTLEREITTLKKDRDSLKDKVQKWGDYENVKQELEVLKSIEFATGDDDEEADLDTTSDQSEQPNGSASTSKGDTLEQLLLTRNKKLTNELTVLRVSHQDLQNRLETLQEELSNTNMDLEKSRALTATLENDLEKVQQEATNAFDSSAMSVAGTYTSRYPGTAYGSRRGRASSPTSSIISGFDNSGPKSTLDAIRAGEPVGGGSGILPMITAQRDRFKKKNTELESELSKAHQSVSSLRSEVASLQKDNLNLYEKTRYVSTYNRGATSSSAYSNANPSAIQMTSNTSSGLTTDRYRSAYESSISPFAAFRGRESARAIKRMSLPERIVFRITRLVLATRASRNLFAFYCMALHILVFMMLYWMSTVEIEQRSSGLSSGTAAAMQAVADGALSGKEDLAGKEWHQESFQEGG
ncbi:hypothetical protein EJ05DRAFT_440424 [Pseudovirgaria hyperparasitica]|uniref:Protein CASP n=1 Tax=Pseudovirgaria hyperparasitica TaxID=470096 RepID=A0A6A6W1S2_9PEZI|nr:uncharacterized protein EJ05DRAFT_440424 [Pseudovirgaria hyperparasitica]KAF2756832.1 hypothetical protein EJ05DRAFT_440424 [Pseudovirgaria hyperparasitica]